MLWRYVFSHCLGGVAVAVLALVAVFTFIEVIDALEDIGRGDYRTAGALAYALSTVPRLLVDVLPVAAVIGVLAGLGGLAGRRELAAMQCAGMSLLAVTGAALTAGLVAALVAMLCADQLAPRIEVPAEARRAAALAGSREALASRSWWLRDGASFVRLEAPVGGAGDGLHGVALYEFDAAGELRSAAYAGSARYLPGAQGAQSESAGWALAQTRRTTLQTSPEGSLHATASELDEAHWQSSVTPALINVLARAPQRMPVNDLRRYIGYRDRNGLDVTRYRLELSQRFVYPFTTLAMVLLAVPLVLRNQARARLATRVALGAAVGVSFHTLNEITALAGIVSGLPAWFAASAMTWVVGVIGVGLLWREA